MSTTHDSHVRCPKCSTDFRATLYSNLHVTRSPEVRQSILDGHFQVFPCPNCGERVRVEPTLLYTDFSRDQWFATFPRHAVTHRSALTALVEEGFRVNMTVSCPPKVKAWAPRFTRRVIFGLPSLRDKLLCEELGLDDRVLEVFKLRLMRDQVPDALHPEGAMLLAGADEERLIFASASPPGTDGTVIHRQLAVPRSALTALAATAGLENSYPMFFTGPVVDWRAVLHPDTPLPPSQRPALTPPWMAAP